MSVAGILNTALSALSSSNSQTTASRKHQFQTEFQQLGQDLQSGNLSAAQTDLTSLQQLLPPNASNTATSSSMDTTLSTSSSSQTNSSVSSLFKQLSQDLQAGNLSAAQQDYSSIQQNLQSRSAHGHHHHHQKSAGQMQQTLDQLGQALQAGSFTNAQQAYSVLQQEYSQLTSLTGAQSAGQYLTSALSLSA